MRNWISRVTSRLGMRLDAHHGPWNPPSSEWGDVDADLRRLRHDLDAIRVRFPDHR